LHSRVRPSPCLRTGLSCCRRRSRSDRRPVGRIQGHPGQVLSRIGNQEQEGGRWPLSCLLSPVEAHPFGQTGDRHTRPVAVRRRLPVRRVARGEAELTRFTHRGRRGGGMDGLLGLAASPEFRRSVSSTLRHTGATLALQEGTNPVLVAFRLGYASTAMIERHYGELVEGFDREIADRLSAARRRSGRSPDLAPVSSLAAAQRTRRRMSHKRKR
jgi:hypothetical protein